MSTLQFNEGRISGMVDLGSHRMYLRGAGPSRKAGAPVVVIEAGLGGSSAEWVAVERAIAAFSRVYNYDRSGSGQSEVSPEPRSAAAMALELHKLLEDASIAPPYILIGHSYSAIIVREYLAAYPIEVSGLVLVDANQERTLAEQYFPGAEFARMLGSLDFYEATGLSTSHRLEPGEWADLRGKEPRSAGREEQKLYESSLEALGLKEQFKRKAMGDRPLSVIFANVVQDIRKIVAAGIVASNGTTEDLTVMQNFITNIPAIEERLQREQLQLSSNSRFTRAALSGHSVHLTEPEIIAAEAHWVYQQCQNPDS